LSKEKETKERTLLQGILHKLLAYEDRALFSNLPTGIREIFTKIMHYAAEKYLFSAKTI
jgi:hypothetical protein